MWLLYQLMQLVPAQNAAERNYLGAHFTRRQTFASRPLMLQQRRCRRQTRNGSIWCGEQWRGFVIATAAHRNVHVLAANHLHGSVVCGALGEVRRSEAQLADGSHFVYAFCEWNEAKN